MFCEAFVSSVCWGYKCREKCVLTVGGSLRNADFKGVISRHLVVKAISAVEARTVDQWWEHASNNLELGRDLSQAQHPEQESFRQHRATVDYCPQRRHSPHCEETRTAEKLINLPPSKCSLLDLLVPSRKTRSSFYSSQLCIISWVNIIDLVWQYLLSVC